MHFQKRDKQSIFWSDVNDTSLCTSTAEFFIQSDGCMLLMTVGQSFSWCALSSSVDVSADLHQLKNQSSPFSYCAACPDAALEMHTEAGPIVNYSDSAPDNPC